MPGTPTTNETGAGKNKARVLILDELPIVRERLAELIGDQPDMVVCGEADDARDARQMIAKAPPDLIVTSLSLKNGHGLDFIKDVHGGYPRVLMLVFSVYDELIYAERAIRAGARGFIRKQERTAEIVRAMRYVLGGEIYMSDRVTVTKVTRFFGRSAVQGLGPLEQLSDRELQVLQLIGHGQSTRQIADALHVDVKTIETYRSRIKVKLSLNTAPELVDYARRWLEESMRVS